MTLNSTRPAFQFRKSPTNPVKQTPRTCVTIQQITCVTVYTNQAPASSSKSHMPATGGCRHLLYVRPWSCAHLHGHAHGHGHTFTGMRTPARPWSHLHGHAYTCTAMAQAISPRPASGSRGSTLQSGLLKFPGGHGHGIASRCGDGVGVGVVDARALHSSPPEGGLLWRGSPGNRGRLDSTKVRRCGVRTIESAGRTTDHAGRRPGPARQKIRRGSRKARRMPAVTAVVFATFSALPFPSRVFPFSLFSVCPVSR